MTCVTSASPDKALKKHFTKAELRTLKKARVFIVDPTCSGSGVASNKTTEDAFKSQFRTPKAWKLLGHSSPSDDAVLNRLSLLGADQAYAPLEGQSAPTGQDGMLSQGERRIHQLAVGQIDMLLHVMALPSAQVVVYSTCSVHFTENEHVVAVALATHNAKDKARQFKLVHALPTWQRRGASATACAEQYPMAHTGVTSAYKQVKPLSKADASHCVRVHPDLDGTDGFFVALLVSTELTDGGD